MKKIAFLVGVLMIVGQVCSASPLTDFSKGVTVVDLNSGVHSFSGSNGFEFTIATGLGNDWAASYRQTGYDTSYNTTVYGVENRELNLVHKINDNIRIYTGYSNTKGYDKLGGQDLKDKSTIQLGTIVSKKLGDKTTLYTILGAGKDVINVEFGLSQQVKAGLEVTATYRHLTVENVGPFHVKENLRGFGLGVTFQI